MGLFLGDYRIAPNFRGAYYSRILLEPQKLSPAKCFEKRARPSRIVDPQKKFLPNVSKDQSAKI